MVRIGIARVLASVDIRVVGEARADLEGLQVLRSGGADLLVLGDHAVDRAPETVRQAKQLPGPPLVVALLARAGRDELIALLEAGADGLLVRSVGPDELAVCVRRLMEGERVVSPALLASLVGMGGLLGKAPSRTDGGGGAPLTRREREVLARLARGRSNDEIAGDLFVTAATVKTHLAHIYAKLGVNGRHQALARAVALGLLN